MFVQFIEWLPKVLSFLDNKTILSDKIKRKQAAKYFLEIFHNMSKLVENGELIQEELQKITSGYRAKNDSDCLNHLLRTQTELLSQFLVPLSSHYGGVTCIYGHPVESIESILGGQITILSFIRRSIYKSKKCTGIPKTFDFMDYKEICKFSKKINPMYIPSEDIRRVGIYDYFKMQDSDNDFLENESMQFSFKKDSQYKNHMDHLYNQIITFKSLEKLRQAREDMSDIIKNNFSLEELF